MQRSIRALPHGAFREVYFTKAAPATISPAGITVIRTGDHFLNCRNALSPHVLDSYMICLIRSGEGVYHFGADSYYLGKNTLCFVPAWTLTSWHSQTAWQDGFCCSFSEAFFNEGQENKHWLKQLSNRGNVVLSLSSEQTAYFSLLLEDLFSQTDADLTRSLLHLLVRKAAAFFPDQHKHIAPGNNAAIKLTQSFMQNYQADFEQLLKGAIREMPSLALQAERLHVTPNHLNDTVKAVTGKSVGQHIQEELSRQASALLQQTNWPISQIADQLGFKDASYFSRFYRKFTGQSPSAVRSQHP